MNELNTIIQRYRDHRAEAEQLCEKNPNMDYTGTFSGLLDSIIHDLESLQSNGKTKEEVEEGFIELLKSLSINGGRIVCTNQLSPHDINDARDSGRMWVDEWGVGYVWMPAPFWPTTPEKVELFEKYYPNPIEVPEELSAENIREWIKKKEREKKDQMESHANKDGWVSCAERFPDGESFILIWGRYTKDCPMGIVYGYFNKRRRKFYALDNTLTKNVTHWMPLPPKPQI